MKNRFVLGLASLGLAAVLFTSCSKVPQVEIDAANVAIEAAKTAQADVYVPEAFVALQDSMKAVMTEVEVQGSKFFKNYKVAKANAISVTSLAGEVKLQSENRIAELKVEIQTAITEVKTLLEADKTLVLEAPKGKEGASALAAIKEELATLDTAIVEANTLLETGELFASLDKVKAAKEKASAINAELTAVIEKYKANSKGRKR
jgi:hypothetical protein